ncbi:MAG TPA: fenitrothion hydrolase [Actinomycetota bacterium]|nr:fenitrothion hydrolase [Actinomycetota bacterium]
MRARERRDAPVPAGDRALTRRRAVVAALAAAWLSASAVPALAHGFGGRTDLPVPLWLFVFGAITALLVSFVALSTLWTEPRFEGRPTKTAGASWLQSILTNRALEWTIRIAMLLAFLVVAMASARRVSETETIGPIVVYAWFWVGLAIAHASLGNLWATLSPFDTAGRLVGFDEGATRPYPTSWGRWPAAIFLFGFVWVELVQPFGSTLGHLGILIVVYALVQILGMHRFGRQVWLENGEAFAVYFGLISGIAPFARDREGRVVTRPFLSGLAQVDPRPGLLAVIMVALGSTTFDGFSRMSLWITATASFGGIARTLVLTAGLVAAIGLVTLAYVLAMRAAARVVGGDWHPLAVRFAHSLVPIVVAYVIAHYFSFLVLEGQLGLVRLSDPFKLGWDLFGTGDWAVNYSLVSPNTIWYVQVAAIVIGHIGAVIVAHDRAIAMFDREDAVRTQYALLAVMVVFTASGLLILSG